MELEQDCILQFEGVLKWRVEDMGYWLEAIGIPEAKEYFEGQKIDGMELIKRGTTLSSIPDKIKKLKKSKKELLRKYMKEFAKEVQARAGGHVLIGDALRTESIRRASIDTVQPLPAAHNPVSTIPTTNDQYTDDDDHDSFDSEEWDDDEVYQNPDEQQPPAPEEPPLPSRQLTEPPNETTRDDLPSTPAPPPPRTVSRPPAPPPQTVNDDDDEDYIVPDDPPPASSSTVAPPSLPPLTKRHQGQGQGQGHSAAAGPASHSRPAPVPAPPTDEIYEQTDDMAAPPPVRCRDTRALPPVPPANAPSNNQPAVPPPPPVSRAGGRQNRPVPQPPTPPQLPIPAVTETVYEISEEAPPPPPRVDRALPPLPPSEDQGAPQSLPPLTKRHQGQGHPAAAGPASHSRPAPVPAPPTDEIYEQTDDTSSSPPPPTPGRHGRAPPPLPSSHPPPPVPPASAAVNETFYEATDDTSLTPAPPPLRPTRGAPTPPQTAPSAVNEDVYEPTDGPAPPPPPPPSGRQARALPPIPGSNPSSSSSSASAVDDVTYEVTDELQTIASTESPSARPLPRKGQSPRPPTSQLPQIKGRGPPAPPHTSPTPQSAAPPKPAPISVDVPDDSGPASPVGGGISFGIGQETLRKGLKQLRRTSQKLFTSHQKKDEEEDSSERNGPPPAPRAPKRQPVAAGLPAPPPAPAHGLGRKAPHPGSPQCVPSNDPGPPGSPPVSSTPAANDPLNKHPWFFGNLNRDVAKNKVVALHKEGAFLVRVSERDAQFPYTICVLHNGEPHNIQIRRRDDNKFALGSKKNKETVHSTVEDLIKFHLNNSIEVITKNGVSANVVLSVNPAK